MTDPLYLILHKVRGEPTFDIAIRDDSMGTPSDPGPWWIIPTSGHRAYPWRWWPLDHLQCVSFAEIQEYDDIVQPLIEFANGVPEDLRDHYPDRPSPSAPRLLGGLLGALGLGLRPELKRRKL